MWGELFKTLNYSRGKVTSIAKKQFCRKKKYLFVLIYATFWCRVLCFPCPWCYLQVPDTA